MSAFKKVSSADVRKQLAKVDNSKGLFNDYPDLPTELKNQVKAMKSSREQAVATFAWTPRLENDISRLIVRVDPSGDGSVEILPYGLGRWTDCMRAMKRLQDQLPNVSVIDPSAFFMQVKNKNNLANAPVPNKISVDRGDGVVEWFKNPKYDPNAPFVDPPKKIRLQDFITWFDPTGTQKQRFDDIAFNASVPVENYRRN